jgi:multiple sugar transport system permease protein
MYTFGRQRLVWILLLSPALLIVLGLTVYPLLQVGFFSFFRYDYTAGTKEFFGLFNYIDILKNRFFLTSIRNTIVFAITATAAEVMGGLLLALLFNRPFRGRRLVLPFMILPMMLSTMVVSAIWRAWFHYDYGLLNFVLRSVGLEGVRWLFDPDLALFSIVLVDFWQWTPLAFLILLAGLQSIPKVLHEAAEVDGASRWQRFQNITLPLLRNHLLLAILLRTVDSFKLFDKVYALTGGGPGLATETISMYVYREGFKFFNVGAASAGSIVMLSVSGVLAVVYAWKILKEQV